MDRAVLLALMDRGNPRADGRVEWFCPHEIGHTVAVPALQRQDEHAWSHGCDGCCGSLVERGLTR